MWFIDLLPWICLKSHGKKQNPVFYCSWSQKENTLNRFQMYISVVLFICFYFQWNGWNAIKETYGLIMFGILSFLWIATVRNFHFGALHLSHLLSFSLLFPSPLQNVASKTLLSASRIRVSVCHLAEDMCTHSLVFYWVL